MLKKPWSTCLQPIFPYGTADTRNPGFGCTRFTTNIVYYCTTYYHSSFVALEEHPDFNKDGMILDTIEKGVNFPVIHILRITEPPPPSTSTTTNNTSTTQGMYKNRVKSHTNLLLFFIFIVHKYRIFVIKTRALIRPFH